MREVILPGALPGIITGLKITLAISWSCVLRAEMVAAQNGLGALIWQAKDWGNLALVLVGMVWHLHHRIDRRLCRRLIERALLAVGAAPALLMAPILAARTVTKSFAAGRGAPMVAVQDLSLDVDEGELVCLLGASGCGKSTILNMFAGFVAA